MYMAAPTSCYHVTDVTVTTSIHAYRGCALGIQHSPLPSLSLPHNLLCSTTLRTDSGWNTCCNDDLVSCQLSPTGGGAKVENREGGGRKLPYPVLHKYVFTFK